MKRFISFIFVFVCFIAQSSILRANHDYIKFIDATECNIDPFKYNFPYYKRKWNGIDIPKDIWKLIDKYRRNLFSIVHLRPALPYKYTPEYIMNKLMSSVDFDCVVLCSQCDVDVPVKFHINKSSNSGNPICLDGLPLRRNYMPPYECPICGTFCGKPISVKDGHTHDFYDNYIENLYLNADSWERYFAYLEDIDNCPSNIDYIELYKKAAWTYKDINELFVKYIIKSIVALNNEISNLGNKPNCKNSKFYFQKAELLRQLGCFDESKKIVKKLADEKLISKLKIDYFNELIENKNSKLAIDVPHDYNELEFAIELDTKDEVSEKIKKLASNKRLLNETENITFTPLSFAIYKGKTNIAKYLLQQGADPNNLEKSHRAPLFQAVVSGNEELVRLMINKDNIELRGDCNYTPLCFAVNEGNLNMVKLLVELGGNPLCFDKKNDSKISVLDIACFGKTNEFNEVVEYLLTLDQINQSETALKSAYNIVKDTYNDVGKIPENELIGTLEMREMLKNALQKLEVKEKNSKEAQK